MAFYENTILAKQDLAVSELEKIKSKYEEIINNSSGKVLKIEDWGLLSLARKIKNYKKAFYIHYKFEGTKKTLNIASHSGNSSFFEVKKKSNWLKLRSQQLGIDEENYISKKIEVGLETVDSYCKNNSVNRIDIMKIDTQLYEEQVLKGSENMIKNEKIDAIEIEIVFSSAYEKYVCFSDIEKYLLPHNYRFSGINLHNNNLFSGTIFFADVLFLNKTKFKL